MKKYKCSVCGFVSEESIPEVCPVCGALSSQFIEITEK